MRILSRLLFAHAAITAAAGVVLAVAPAAIPGAVGIRLAPDAFLVCYLLAAAEFAFAALSYWGAGLTDARSVRVVVLTLVVLHGTSALLEILAIVRGADARLWLNVVARSIVLGLFLRFLPASDSRGGRH